MPKKAKAKKAAARATGNSSLVGRGYAQESSAMLGVPRMSLNGFLPVMWPTVLPAKLVYTDYRVLTATANQASYVYRLNSVFDTDFSGVGGQPAGFDQLKTLYGRYRVMACQVTVEATSNSSGGNGLLAIGPCDNSSFGGNAEDVADLRFAKSKTFTQAEVCRLKALYHIGELLGYSDESMLANPNVEAAINANPNFGQFLFVNVETGNSATSQTMVMVKLVYFVRMEVPIAIDDAAMRARRNAARAVFQGLPTKALVPVDSPVTSKPQLSGLISETVSSPMAVTVASATVTSCGPCKCSTCGGNG